MRQFVGFMLLLVAASLAFGGLNEDVDKPIGNYHTSGAINMTGATGAAFTATTGAGTLRATAGAATLRGGTTADVTADAGALTARATAGAATLRGGTTADVTADSGTLSLTSSAGALTARATTGAATLRGGTTTNVTADAGMLTLTSSGSGLTATIASAIDMTGGTGAALTATTGAGTLRATAGAATLRGGTTAGVVADSGTLSITATGAGITATAATTAQLSGAGGLVLTSSGAGMSATVSSDISMTGGTGFAATATTNDAKVYASAGSAYVGASDSSRVQLWDGNLPYKTAFLPAGAALDKTGGTACAQSAFGAFECEQMSSGDDLEFSFTMPEDACAAPVVSVTFYVVWTTTATVADGGWRPAAVVRAVDADEDVANGGDAQTLGNVDVAAPAATNLLTRTSLGTFTAQPGRRCWISIDLTRNAVGAGAEMDAGDNSKEPAIIGIEVRYQVDRLGE